MTPELPDGTNVRLHDFTRWIGTWVFHVIFRLRVHGAANIPATGPVVLVSNHSAFIDGPLLYGLAGRRCVFLVKHEVYRGPLGWFLRAIGQVPVRRGEPDRTPLLTSVRVLRAGGLVGVFPEGTRGDGEVASARQGAAWLARSADAVVLPVACRGTRRPGGRRRFRPRVDVLIGPPVAVPSGRGRAALGVATERIRGELTSLVARLDEIRSGGPVTPSAPDETGADGQRRHGE
ncbi:MAG TPA: lysophospholipid acyltransferase family protein [Pseudonocardiaceae bacterium]